MIYVIDVDPNVAGFLISKSIFPAMLEILAYVFKKIYLKHKRHLCLVAYIFTKVLQSVYLIN